MSASITVVLMTRSRDEPWRSRTAAMLARTWRVSGPTPPATSAPLASVPSAPERYRTSPTRTASEYGRGTPALGAAGKYSALDMQDLRSLVWVGERTPPPATLSDMP